MINIIVYVNKCVQENIQIIIFCNPIFKLSLLINFQKFKNKYKNNEVNNILKSEL